MAQVGQAPKQHLQKHCRLFALKLGSTFDKTRQPTVTIHEQGVLVISKEIKKVTYTQGVPLEVWNQFRLQTHD